jgi:hypothetical protein
MEKWAEIRRRVLNGEVSKRFACAEYEIHWETLQKILTHTEPPGYRRTKRRTSKLDPYLPIIHEILQSNRKVHRKGRGFELALCHRYQYATDTLHPFGNTLAVSFSAFGVALSRNSQPCHVTGASEVCHSPSFWALSYPVRKHRG